MTVLSQAPVAEELYEQHVNSQWVRLLNLLQMNVEYSRCLGAELWTRQGRRILDFLSGYCVYNTGCNHPPIIAAMVNELRKKGPVMLQSHIPDNAAHLAARLSQLAGGRLEKVYFTSSGSEGTETVIKFSRAFTGRSGLLYCQGALHGLTCGALSLMGDPFWRDGFGPLLPNTVEMPFGSLEALEEQLSTRRFAAFLWSLSRLRRVFACPLRLSCRRPRLSANATERSLFWTRFKPVCSGPDLSWPPIISASTLIWWCWPKR